MHTLSVTQTPHALTCLPRRPQLFLWTIRHQILAVGNHQPLCTHVQKTVEIADIPMLPFLIEELLHTFAQYARRRIEFSHPSSNQLLPDERRFLACLQSLMQQPTECGCEHLAGMIDADGVDKVMPRFALVAATLHNCRPTCAGWPMVEAVDLQDSSATVH